MNFSIENVASFIPAWLLAKNKNVKHEKITVWVSLSPETLSNVWTKLVLLSLNRFCRRTMRTIHSLATQSEKQSLLSGYQRVARTWYLRDWGRGWLRFWYVGQVNSSEYEHGEDYWRCHRWTDNSRRRWQTKCQGREMIEPSLQCPCW